MKQTMEKIDETKGRIRDSVEEFIEIINANKSSPPKKEIPRVVTGEEAVESFDTSQIDDEDFYAATEEVEIPKPSEVVSEYKKVGSFEEVAEWLVSEDGPSTIDTDEKDRWVRRLRYLAGETMDYAGAFEFSEECFEEAFNCVLRPRFVENPKRKIIIPIVNLAGDFDELEFEYPNTILEDANKSEDEELDIVNDITISKITDEERAGMLQAENRSSGFYPPMTRIKGTHKIEFSFFENAGRNFESIRKRIITAFRLFKPKYDISLGSVYQTVGHWISYQYRIPSYTESFEEKDFQVMSFSPYTLDGGESTELEDFWSDYHPYIMKAFTDTRDAHFSRPIQRYTEMYNERKNEDSIIDCFISIEQTILKDIRPSYKFRFPARSALLLAEVTEEEYDSEYIYDFFNQLHHVRNEIIHGDKTIDEINNDVDLPSIADDDLESQNFVNISRYFLASSINRYMKYDKEEEMNITQVNMEIIDPAMKKQLKKIPYPTGEK